MMTTCIIRHSVAVLSEHYKNFQVFILTLHNILGNKLHCFPEMELILNESPKRRMICRVNSESLSIAPT